MAGGSTERRVNTSKDVPQCWRRKPGEDAISHRAADLVGTFAAWGISARASSPAQQWAHPAAPEPEHGDVSGSSTQVCA